jgi:hypothetical protein
MRRMKRFLRALRPRPIAALLAIHLAMAGTGIPCLLVCVAGEARDHDAAWHESHGAEHRDSCPDDLPCVKDQSPAVSAHADAPFVPDAGGMLPVFLAPLAAPPGLTMLALRSMPDRSPPIPPGFAILRI